MRKSGEAWRRAGLTGVVSRRRRQSAVRRRPTELGPLDGRHAEDDGPRRNRRHPVAESLAQSAVVMTVRMAGPMTMVVIPGARFQADFAQAVNVDAPRGRNAIHHRREGLNGQRQCEKNSCEPPAGHERRNLTLVAQDNCARRD